MSKEEIIVTIICAVLGSGALNGILTHILYKNKLGKELKIKGHEMIANKIGESLQFVRNMELELTKQEIYDIKNMLDVNKEQIDFFEGECIYLSIFNDDESFKEFMNMVHECRSKHEKNLSVKLALNLAFMEKYLCQLKLFLAKFENESLYPFWGTIFIFDLQKWQKRIDKMLVKEINKFTYKLESHFTIKWKILRRKELIRQYQSTILFYLLNGKCRNRDKKKMEFLTEILNNVISKEMKNE